MPTTLKTAVANDCLSRNPARSTRAEYQTTLRKWKDWGGGVSIERLGRKEIRDFLDWVYERAVAEEGGNPGRTANKAREHLRAVISWAWEQDLIESPPRFPKPKEQRDVAGRHYLTKTEINALYFATHKMKTATRLESSDSCRSVLAMRPRRVLQLRRRHRDHLEDTPATRADPLAARILESASHQTGKSRNSRPGDGYSTAG